MATSAAAAAVTLSYASVYCSFPVDVRNLTSLKWDDVKIYGEVMWKAGVNHLRFVSSGRSSCNLQLAILKGVSHE